MIFVKLMGGLGNQMFQYAAARSLAHRHATRVILDATFLEGTQEGNTYRVYSLNHLKIRQKRCHPAGAAGNAIRSVGPWRDRYLHILRVAGLARPRPEVFRERHFHFDQDFEAVPDNTYLDGYWQSEKYFKDISQVIRKEFVVRYRLTGANKAVAERIASVDSVSVHVRRGDYVSQDATYLTHGVCEGEYYLESMEEMNKRVKNPHYFVFSDEPDWVEKHMNFPSRATIIRHNPPEKSYEDLRLMRLCKNHIIANSSFSWWGAWLNENAGKVVIAPKKWFRDPSHDTSDLIPDGWLRL
jgi:hypothetical protein